MKNGGNIFSKSKIKAVAAWAGIIFGGYLVVVAVAAYAFPSSSQNRIVRATLAVVPYPAAIANGRLITLNELFSLSDSVKKFYENQDFSKVGLRVDFDSADGEKRLKIKEKNVLTKLIENSIIEKEARASGIRLTDEIIGQELDRKLKEYGSEENLKSTLLKLYGWQIDDFKENIVKPDLYRAKLFEQIKKGDNSYETASSKILEAQNELKKQTFAKVAEIYSDGESAKFGGELGWFTADQMLPEVALVAFNLEKGKTSDIIESSIGYHIVGISDKKKENETEMVKVKQIFIRTKSFSEWLAEKEKNASIIMLAPGYRWDKQKNRVEFKNSGMKEFEEKLINNSYYDASILF